LKTVYYRLHLHETKGGQTDVVKTQLNASQKLGKIEKTNRNCWFVGTKIFSAL